MRQGIEEQARIIDFEVQIIGENNIATIDKNLSNILDFEQEVHALYSQYGKKFNTFSFLAESDSKTLGIC